MEENQMPEGSGAPNFEGHPTQAHADHATIMKAHGIISDPHRMNAVHALHAHGGGLIGFLKKKQKELSMKPAAAPSENAPAPSDGAEEE